MPEYDSNDKLTLTLDALRSDVERTPLADSMTVRRRGDQRTRRQAVGGAVAVVALVAGVAGVLGGAGGINKADGVPPATGGPTASTEVEQPLTLASHPLLDPSDLGRVGVYTDWQANPSPEEANISYLRCMPSPDTLAAEQTEAGLFYNDLDSRATEHVLRFPDAESAFAAAGRLFSAFAACDKGPASDHVVDRGPTDVPVASADSAQELSRASAPPDSDYAYYELAVARKGNVLLVLQWTSMGQPDGVDWVWDSERLSTALDRAID
jgi:hypothetical protein